MRILIVEDEHYAAKRLASLVKAQIENTQILATLDTVEDTCAWLHNNPEPELIFMDIQLADGLSFQIFEDCKINCPVIFTTAYDEYALEAFKVNSIDYLLKPIEEEELKRAIEKYKQLFSTPNLSSLDWKEISKEIFQEKKNYKERFLIKTGSAFTYLKTEDLNLIFSEDGLSFAINQKGQKFHIDKSLDKIDSLLDPHDFFRISRKHIVSLQAIHKIHSYFNNRLKIEMKHPATEEIIVSREKVKSFKNWIDQ